MPEAPSTRPPPWQTRPARASVDVERTGSIYIYSMDCGATASSGFKWCQEIAFKSHVSNPQSLVAAACALTAQALHPLQILPVGRPLLPLDQISYGLDAKTLGRADGTTRRAEPIVVGLHAPNTDAGTLCILDASRASEEFGRIRVPAEAVGRYGSVQPKSGRAAARHPQKGRREARGRSNGRLAIAESGRSGSAMGAKPSRGAQRAPGRRARQQCCASGRRIPGPPWKASVLRLPRAFADFAAARRNCTPLALARASGALDAAEAAGVYWKASTGARLDDARAFLASMLITSCAVAP